MEEIEEKLSKLGCNSVLPYLGLSLLNYCFVFLQTAFVPGEYYSDGKVHDFSCAVGGTCDDVMGKNNLVGMPEATIRCVKVFIEQRGHEQLRDFMDVYIASLLFSTYLIHQLPKMLIHAEGFKRLCELMFVLVSSTEIIVLVSSAIHVHAMWIRGDYVSSNPETILDEYNPYSLLYQNLTMSSSVLRFLNWTSLGVIVLLDVRGRMRDYSASCSAFMHNTRFIRWTMRAYAFCFIVLMNVAMLLALYFYQRNELPTVDFSYLVGGDCDDVAGMTEEQYLALEETPKHEDTELCIKEFLANLIWHDRIPGFMLCYLTVALFYVLLIIEALEFFSDEKRKTRAQRFTGTVVLFEAIGFMVLAGLVIHCEEPSLVHNDVHAVTQKYYCWTMVWTRLASMLVFYYMYLQDESFSQIRATRKSDEDPDLDDIEVDNHEVPWDREEKEDTFDL